MSDSMDTSMNHVDGRTRRRLRRGTKRKSVDRSVSRPVTDDTSAAATSSGSGVTLTHCEPEDLDPDVADFLELHAEQNRLRAKLRELRDRSKELEPKIITYMESSYCDLIPVRVDETDAEKFRRYGPSGCVRIGVRKKKEQLGKGKMMRNIYTCLRRFLPSVDEPNLETFTKYMVEFVFQNLETKLERYVERMDTKSLSRLQRGRRRSSNSAATSTRAAISAISPEGLARMKKRRIENPGDFQQVVMELESAMTDTPQGNRDATDDSNEDDDDDDDDDDYKTMMTRIPNEDPTTYE